MKIKYEIFTPNSLPNSIAAINTLYDSLYYIAIENAGWVAFFLFMFVWKQREREF